MTNRYVPLYSTGSGLIPSASDFVSVGELAVNVADARIFTKDQNNNVVLLSGPVGNLISASYASTASLLLGSIVSASYALTASYAANAGSGGGGTTSGSFTGSFTGSATNAVTASFVSASYAAQTAISASYAITSSYATIAQNVLGSITSASYALTASYATIAQNVLGSITSASYAATASAANNFIATSTSSLAYATGSFIGDGSRLTGIPTSSVGKQTIWIPATAMWPRLFSGSAFISQSQFTTTTSNHMSMDFDPVTSSFAQFYVAMPKAWDKTNLVSQFYWTHTSSSVNFNVIWGIHSVAILNSGSFTGSYTTNTEVTASGGKGDYLYVTSETPNIAVGSPGANDLMSFELYRSASAGADNLSVNARLIGIKLIYTTNNATDN